MTRRARRIAYVVLGVAVAVGVATYAFVLAPLAPAAAFLEGLAGPEPDAAALAQAGLLRCPREGPVEFVYLPPPAGRGAAPVLVTVAGVTPRGVEDPRVLRLLLALRAAGFAALAPEIPGLARLGEGGDGLEVVRRALRWTQTPAPCGRLPGADPSRVGVLGVSLGAPLALRAAATTEVPVQVVLLVGSPDDPRALARAWFAEPVAAAGAAAGPAQRSSAGVFARHGLLRVAAGTLLPASEAAPLRAWLDAAGETPLARAAPPPPTSSDAARRWVRAARAEDALDAADREWILRAADDLLADHAPAAWDAELARLTSPVYLVHGAGDPLVPPEEMDRLVARLRGRVPVRALSSRLLSHVDVDSPGWRETWRHLRWVAAAFEDLEDPVR